MQTKPSGEPAMKKRPKPCFTTVAILACVATVLLSASLVVAEVVVTRLVQGVQEAPPAAPLIVQPAQTSP
jgi:hypothetical protein